MASDRAAKRDRVIHEILDTEKAYVESINILIDVYLAPLRAQATDVSHKSSLKPEYVNGIFANIEVIGRFHMMFHLELTKNATAEGFADVFLKYADFMKMYTTYVNGYARIMECINHLQNKKEFQTHCQEARKKAKNMDLMSYLIMPVQRIPRYELLLKELKSKLEPDSPTTAKLEEALSKIQSIAQHVNEMKRKAERLSELLVIQGKIHGGAEMKDTLLQPHRRLIHEGEVHMKATIGMKSRRYFLFNDLLLWTDKNYKYKDNLKVVGISAVNERPADVHGDKADLAFEIKHPKEDLVLYCDSEAEKQTWLKGLQEAIRESKEIEADLNVRSGLTPASTTDQQAQRHRRGSHSVHDSGDNHAPPPGSHGARHRADSASQSTGSGNGSSGPHSSMGSSANPRLSVPASPANSTLFTTPLSPMEATTPMSQPSPSPTASDTPMSTVNGSPQNASDSSKSIAFHLPADFASVPSSTTNSQSTDSATSSTSTSTASTSATVTVNASGTTTTTITSATTGGSVNFHMTPTALSTPNMSPASNGGSPQTVFSFAVNSSVGGSPAHSNNGTPRSGHVPGSSPSNGRHPLPTMKEAEEPKTLDYFDAVDALRRLSRNDITALKRMKSPPIPVKLAIEALAIVLQIKGVQKSSHSPIDYWGPVQALLVRPNFLTHILSVNTEKGALDDESVAQLKKYIENPRLDPAHVFNSSLPAGVLWNWVRAVYGRQTGVTLPAYHYKREKLTDEQKAAKFKSHRGNAHMRTASGHFTLPEDALLADDEVPLSEETAAKPATTGASPARPTTGRRASLELKSPPVVAAIAPPVQPAMASLPGRGGPKRAPQLKQPRKDVPSRIDMGAGAPSAAAVARARAKTLGTPSPKRPATATSASPAATTATATPTTPITPAATTITASPAAVGPLAGTASVRPATGGPPGLFRPPSIVAPNLIKNLLSPPGQPSSSPDSSPSATAGNGHNRTHSVPVANGTNGNRRATTGTRQVATSSGNGRSRSPSPRGRTSQPPSPRSKPRPSPLWVPPTDDGHDGGNNGHTLSASASVPTMPQSARGARPATAAKKPSVASGARHPATPQAKRPASASVTAGLATTTMGATARAQAGVTKSRFSHRVGGAKPAAGPRIGGMGRGFAHSADIAATGATTNGHHDDDVRSVGSSEEKDNNVVTITVSSSASLIRSPPLHNAKGVHALKPVRNNGVRSATMTAAVPPRSTRPDYTRRLATLQMQAIFAFLTLHEQSRVGGACRRWLYCSVTCGVDENTALAARLRDEQSILMTALAEARSRGQDVRIDDEKINATVNTLMENLASPLGMIQRKELSVIRSLAKPPRSVVRVFEGVHLLLNSVARSATRLPVSPRRGSLTGAIDDVMSSARDPKLLEKLAIFTVTNINAIIDNDTAAKLTSLCGDDQFKPGIVAAASMAASHLCEYVIAVTRIYNFIAEQPGRIHLVHLLDVLPRLETASQEVAIHSKRLEEYSRRYGEWFKEKPAEVPPSRK